MIEENERRTASVTGVVTHDFSHDRFVDIEYSFEISPGKRFTSQVVLPSAGFKKGEKVRIVIKRANPKKED